MKLIKSILGGLAIIGGLIALSGFIHAQVTTGPVQSISGSTGQPDSVVQIAADSQGLALVPSDQLPKAGTFWTVGGNGLFPVPYPCPVNDPNAIFYAIGPSGVFLVDATDGAVLQPIGRQAMLGVSSATLIQEQLDSVLNLIAQVQEAQVQEAQAMAKGAPPFPGVGGSDSSTNGDGGGASPNGSPAQNYGTNLWIAQVNISSNNLTGIASNTTADVEYEIQSLTDLTQTNWVSQGFILGSETTNWTPLNALAVSLTNNFFIRLRSWASSDGSGLPDWWELEYFGHTGVDPNADPAGDGWSNIQKFQNGMNPNVFYTPAAPQGLTASYDAGSSTAAISWQSSPSSVTGYTLQKYDAMTGQTTDYNFGTNITSFVDNVSSDLPDPLLGNILEVTYEIQACYGALGDSYWGGPVPLGQNTLTATFIAGPQGSAYVAVPTVPVGTVALRVTRLDFYAWQQYYYYGGSAPYVTNFDIPISSSTNGLYLIPSSWCVMQPDAYGDVRDYDWSVQTVNTNGVPNATGTPYEGYYFYPEDNRDWLVPPYFDGRAQLKQNLIFLLRAATTDSPFAYTGVNTNSFGIYNFVNPTGYAYAGFYPLDENVNDQNDYEDLGYFDAYWPFENNYRYRNFVFNSSELDASGRTTTGTGGNYNGNSLPIPPFVNFNSGLDLLYPNPITYQFQPPATNGASISALLATNQTKWLATYALDSDFSWLWKIGATNSGGVNGLFNNVRNWYGLPFRSVNIAYNAGSSFGTNVLTAGNTTTAGGTNGYFYPETAQPQFQTVEYDFWNLSPVPGSSGFATTNQSELLIVPVGVSSTYYLGGYSDYRPPGIQINGYAKLAVTNGYNGVYAYLGQYFTNAYMIDTNGNVTTNTTGVLSPYGQFVATQPGLAALVTMPDIDTGERGTCTVYCVSIALDKNHDGNMDLSWNGLDATSQNSPFVFWANNNYDRWLYDSDDATNYEDALNSIDVAKLSADQQVPDCHYGEYYGTRIIPTARDLEDFARLWVCGITTNLLAALPANSTVTLSWGDVGNPNPGNPTIDLFAAADSNGGIGYLTNSTIAANQINPAVSPYIGRLAPGGSIQLNANYFGNIWRGNYFIWCGVTNGSGHLSLTIADANGYVLAQSSVWIQIVDIKQMYERWTVGDNPNVAPANVAVIATDGLQTNPPVPAFQYPPPQDTNTPYVLFVHGWNMRMDDKDHFAETAFKRIYWQGYQGRFGLFRWPTDNGFEGTLVQLATSPSEKDNFDRSEYNAWQSGAGLLNLLTSLNAEYPGHVYMFAHSLGNVVAGEALRLDETTQVVNTYVASQAAVTAHTYDPTIPSYSFYYSYLGVPISTVPKTPDIYGGWFSANGAMAGTIVNFYNTNDYALQRSVWQLNQLLKPDQFVPEYGTLWDYGYNGSTNDFQPWNHFFKENMGTYAITNLDIVNILANHYEVMAFAAQAYTTALGATPNVGNLTGNIYLGRVTSPQIWPPDPTGNNYSEHFWHSAEFRGDNPMAQGYWSELLGTEAFNLK